MTSQSLRLPFVFNDGGRSEAGFRGQADDCVARAVAIAAGLSYAEVYAAIAKGVGAERGSKGATARRGVHTGRKWFRDFMCELGFTWVPTMHVGKGCTTHLSHGELPMGRLVVKLSKHTVAVVDGVIHDTFDPSRETEVAEADGSVRLANRCVYGYWILSVPG
ncbi:MULTISPECIES: hypothetical protein [unclassified Pseudomonas]|uniref:hypothetical protein n=1 Tax=unclassified Pseudomonas TaxID=196821 RepID=UPI001CBC202A|nr:MULTISPECIES: hypothetical protein [unclassified Pseudomonas]